MEDVPQFYLPAANEQQWVSSSISEGTLVMIELTPRGDELARHAASHLVGDTLFANDPAECVKALLIEALSYAAWEQMFYGQGTHRRTDLP